MFDPCPTRQRDARERTGKYLTRRERRCIGKRKHTMNSAHQEANRLLGLGEERIRAYRCNMCQQWHVGRTKRADVHISNIPTDDSVRALRHCRRDSKEEVTHEDLRPHATGRHGISPDTSGIE